MRKVSSVARSYWYRGDGGPNIGAKISQLGDQEPLGIYGVQVGGVASGVGRQQQVPGFLIIKQEPKEPSF